MKSLRKVLSVFTLLIFIALMSIGIIGCKSKKNVEEVKVVETIPFELIDGIIILDVKINKTVDAKFIFDSGEESMTLDPNLIEKLKLKNVDTKELLGMASSKYVPIYNYLSVSLGDFTIDSIQGGAIDLSAQTKMLGTQIDGLVGYEILNKYVCEINYDKQIIKLSKTLETDVSDYTQKPLFASDKLPVLNNCKSVFQDSFELTGNFVLDFGANTTVIMNTLVATENGLYDRIGKNFHSGNVSTTGRHQTHTGRLKTFTFADYTFNSTAVSLGTSYSGFLGKMGYTGLLGNGFLKRFNTIYDLPSRKIYFKPSKYFNDKPIVNCTGISLKSNLSFDSVFVSKVYENTVGYNAGIKANDQLLRINAEDVSKYKLNELKEILNKAGEKVKLEFKREDKEYEVNLTLEEII